MAVYSSCNHLYLTAKFTASASGAWVGETWQYGLRVRAGTGQPSLNAGVVDLPNFSVEDAAVGRDTGVYDVDQTWSGVTVGGNTVTDAQQDALVTAFIQPFMDNKVRLASNYSLEVVKMYAVHKAPDGRWLSGSPNSWFPKTTQKGGDTDALPPDVASVVSFYSATRGVKGRGRVYFGGLGQLTMANTGRIQPTTRDGLGNSFAQAFADIRTAGSTPGLQYTPIIWHRPGDLAGLEDGTRASVIQRVEINDVFDTQRRRDKQAIAIWDRYDIP